MAEVVVVGASTLLEKVRVGLEFAVDNDKLTLLSTEGGTTVLGDYNYCDISWNGERVKVFFRSSLSMEAKLKVMMAIAAIVVALDIPTPV